VTTTWVLATNPRPPPYPPGNYIGIVAKTNKKNWPSASRTRVRRVPANTTLKPDGRKRCAYIMIIM